MNKWREVYESKLTVPLEVAKTVRNGDRIFCGSGSCTPDAMLDALFERVEELRDARFGGLIMLGPLYRILSEDKVVKIQFDNYYATPLDRKSMHYGISVHTPFHRYQMNAFFAAGSKALYDWLDDNPMVCFAPTSYNNNPNNVAKNDDMVAVNSTLEIDITGQCCFESLGPLQYTATGGQVDFTHGAFMAPGGKAFIATHSTAVDKATGETVSKITPRLRPGATVTLTRIDVMYVATEYGVVLLKGLSLRERARALISIAPGLPRRASKLRERREVFHTAGARRQRVRL